MRKNLYQIVVKRSVLKEIRRLPAAVLERIHERIAALAMDPVPPDAEAIQGYAHIYRLRIGSYRVVYEVAAQIRIITLRLKRGRSAAA